MPPLSEKWYQKKTRKENVERVLAALSEGAKHFNQLRELTKFSPTTLGSILKQLQKEKKIKKIIHHNREAYALTGRGHKEYKRIWHILNALEEMRNNGGGYIYRRPVTEWGLSYHQAMNVVKKEDNAEFPFLIPNPVLDKDKGKLEEFFLPVVVQAIKEHNLNLENAKSKVIWALELDAGQFGNFFRKIRHFMDLVINEKDILQDEMLGFSETLDRTSLLKNYASYALKFNDREFESKLEQCRRRLVTEGLKL